jgi:hypothetical protein
VVGIDGGANIGVLISRVFVGVLGMRLGIQLALFDFIVVALLRRVYKIGAIDRS